MILWEMKQISYCENIETVFFTERLMRISRYFDMLTTSFSIMEDGMEVDQYMKFRNTLTPASGFPQYRLIEFSSTDLINLLTIGSETPSIETLLTNMLLNIYIGKRQVKTMQRVKSYLLEEFERKYKKMFLDHMKEYKSINIWQKFKQLPDGDQKILS
jgi:tryptophan 2,3-dioxygenase